MLSRFVMQNALMKQSPLKVISRGAALLPTSDKHPERDLINFPRRKRAVDPEPCRHIAIPERWFEFFYPKLGVTGPYTFTFGLTTYLLSKEIWVTEHDFGYALASLIIIGVVHNKFGAQLGNFLNKEIENEAAQMDGARNSKIQSLKDGVEDELWNQERAKAQSVLFEARRENVQMQLEAAFRERALFAYQQVKNRLEYQAALESIHRRISQKHMVSWVVAHVLKSITPDQDKSTVKKCIADLKSIAASA
uniref:ATP synthase subunit b n=1 Tax=Cacopsylla melanoneura TaxID=428564 RepID=A0A8D9A2L4_9HEMI